MIKKKRPIGIDNISMQGFVLENADILERLKPTLVVPLVSGKEMVGLIFLGKKN